MELESEFDAQNTIFLRTSISLSNNTVYDNNSIRSNGSQSISPPGKTTVLIKYKTYCLAYK